MPHRRKSAQTKAASEMGESAVKWSARASWEDGHVGVRHAVRRAVLVENSVTFFTILQRGMVTNVDALTEVAQM